MTQYLIRRVLYIIPIMLGASILIFALIRIAPGDISVLILEGAGKGTAQSDQVQKLRQELGLDKPIHQQYIDWLGHIVRLDLGRSFWTNRPIIEEIKNKYPISMQMAIIAVLLSLIIAIPIGVLSAIYQDTWIDYVFRIVTVAGLAVPNFWMGILIILALVAWFQYTPPLGFVPFWVDPWKNFQQMVWPAVALGYRLSAIVSRVTRSQMLEVLRQDYIRTARAKGIKDRVVVYRHALKNALLPVVTITGVQLGALLGGTVITETVFNIPGMGRQLIEAINFRDYPMVEAIVLISALTFALLNLLVDVMYVWLDPRVKYT